eukprot:TRINITY_DN12911_c0_g1_i6.p1 TRINITY_DN12911_c0_g1~~TRINITY_DN12911_c0_g1_i6.p1  ORF type:complete len:532 (-),score=85.45 TRINITY_DN12911_c0_g1_i6:353-1861(-)
MYPESLPLLIILLTLVHDCSGDRSCRLCKQALMMGPESFTLTCHIACKSEWKMYDCVNLCKRIRAENSCDFLPFCSSPTIVESECSQIDSQRDRDDTKDQKLSGTGRSENEYKSEDFRLLMEDLKVLKRELNALNQRIMVLESSNRTNWDKMPPNQEELPVTHKPLTDEKPSETFMTEMRSNAPSSTPILTSISNQPTPSSTPTITPIPATPTSMPTTATNYHKIEQLTGYCFSRNFFVIILVSIPSYLLVVYMRKFMEKQLLASISDDDLVTLFFKEKLLYLGLSVVSLFLLVLCLGKEIIRLIVSLGLFGNAYVVEVYLVGELGNLPFTFVLPFGFLLGTYVHSLVNQFMNTSWYLHWNSFLETSLPFLMILFLLSSQVGSYFFVLSTAVCMEMTTFVERILQTASENPLQGIPIPLWIMRSGPDCYRFFMLLYVSHVVQPWAIASESSEWIFFLIQTWSLGPLVPVIYRKVRGWLEIYYRNEVVHEGLREEDERLEGSD